jgi:hypothetical protein
MTAESINYTREAFFHPMNLGFLFLSGLSAFFLNDVGVMAPFVMSVAVGLEMVYLGTIPRTTFFQKLVQRRALRQVNQVRDDRSLFYGLDAKSQKRFLVMKTISERVRENFETFPSTSMGLANAIKAKIQGLLTNYLMVLDSTMRFNQYVTQTREQHLLDEIAAEMSEFKGATSEKLKDIKRRRMAILNKRLDRLKGAREKLKICESQLETIEDAIRYIYEQSLTMSNPDQIGLQLDTLLTDMEETVTIIEELEDDALPGYTLIENMPDEMATEPKASRRNAKGTVSVR